MWAYDGLQKDFDVPILMQTFRKRALAVAGAAVILVGAAATAGAAGGVSDVTGNVDDIFAALQITDRTPKVDVCHIPSDDPDNAHSISVGESALDEHLAHGDSEGTCAEGGALGQSDGAGPSSGVDVCHTPSDNPDNAHTISVGESALDEHLAHGDSEGACA